ncbi:MAG: hypothetical protein JWP04_2173 [Belnapia sp.]|nr:hypothetical protein [Belnapia sp.]
MRAVSDQAEAAASSPLSRPHRWLLLGGGYLCLLLAAIGAVLPLMPTTVFLLIAVWCFGRASPALRNRLLNHPRFGPGLRDWDRHGAISLRAKRAALLAMGLSWLLILVVFRDPLIAAIAGGSLALVGLFLVTRPSRPANASTEDAAG